MKLFSLIKLATIATTVLTFSVLPNFAQDAPEPTTPEPATTEPATTESATTFPDISDNVYKAEIEEAVKLGIIKGFPDGTFQPDETVSREQFAVMLVQAINSITPIDLDEKPTRTVPPFQDLPADRWSAKAIYWLQWNLFPANTAQLTGNFRPEDPITRIMAIDFLRRTGELVSIKLTGNAELEETEEPIEFSDVLGYDKVLTMQMSAFCRVASPLNEEGDAFVPEEQANRDYTAAAIVRAVTCEEPSEQSGEVPSEVPSEVPNPN